MGPVNMMALEEYNECDQRYTFLTRLNSRLLQSIEDTARRSLNSTKFRAAKFEEAFATINAEFRGSLPRIILAAAQAKCSGRELG